MNLTGTWQGQYSFDPDDKLPKLPDRPISFLMTLKQGWFSSISGSAQDDPNHGMPEPAKISGRLKNNRLTLTKSHPTIRLVHDGKFESTAQLAERYRVALDEYPPPHPKIHCLGTISDDGQSISGEWLLNSGEIHIPGSRSLQLPALRGTWSMKRSGKK
ncbi:MAG: hypothetical protein FWD61_13055 [Phycisphaerales bacterium]|nr:hypothetical protein [Phycisphaerales bacterium]